MVETAVEILNEVNVQESKLFVYKLVNIRCYYLIIGYFVLLLRFEHCADREAGVNPVYGFSQQRRHG